MVVRVVVLVECCRRGRAAARGRRAEGGAYSFVACLSHWTVDHASLSRRSGEGRREGLCFGCWCFRWMKCVLIIALCVDQ